MTAGQVIAARALDAGYGDRAVVRGLDLDVHRGEVVALLGANGAGKTTTMQTLAGVLPALGGEVLLNGMVTRAPLHQRARQGMAYVSETRCVFMQMTTLENLKVGRVAVAAALELFPELGERLDVKAGLLSGGEQQMLALARVLARRPDSLLADELSMGLAPLAVDRLLSAVRAAADREGLAVLLVEQHINKALTIADRVYVMSAGRIELTSTSAEARERLHEIEDAYLSARPGSGRGPEKGHP